MWVVRFSITVSVSSVTRDITWISAEDADRATLSVKLPILPPEIVLLAIRAMWWLLEIALKVVVQPAVVIPIARVLINQEYVLVAIMATTSLQAWPARRWTPIARPTLLPSVPALPVTMDMCYLESVV